LENVLKDLRSRRVALAHFTQEHRAILAPVRRLPSEILGEVFSLCLHHRWQDRVFDVREAPLLISQVCVGWRDAALSNAKLWSTISIVLQDSVESELALVETWLDRAGGHPLSIRLIDLWQTAAHPVLDLILSRCDRWQHIELDVAPSFFDGLDSGLSTLESASFLTGAIWTQPMNTFLQASRLHCLHIFSHCMTQMPWSQLTELHAHELSPQKCVEIIRQTLNLISCELGFILGNDMEALPPPTCQIRLSQLRILRVFSSETGYLFDNLTLPALLEIQLKQHDAQVTPWIDPFISLLHRSSCAVQKLHLECDQPISDDRLIRFLQNTPSLITLELRGYAASNLGTRGLMSLTHQAFSHQGAICIVPDLQTIKLQYIDSHIFDGGAFVDMISSRWNFDVVAAGDRKARLKTAHVSIFHRSKTVTISSEETLRRLRTFRDEGLDIRVFEEQSNLSLLSNVDVVADRGGVLRKSEK
jgi:hypothetical protein